MPVDLDAVSRVRLSDAEGRVGLEASRAGHDVEEIRLEDGLELELTCASEHRTQNLDEAVVPTVAYDSEADHPVSASLSSRARTRAAMPTASSPHDASCRARDAA